MNFRDHEKELDQNPDYRNAKEKLKIHFAIANAVYKARVQKGWSQSELAKKIGTKQANISRIEAGLGNPTIDLIQKLAKVLDFHLELTVDLLPDTIINFIEGSTSFQQLDYPIDGPNKSTQQEVEKCFTKFSLKPTSEISQEVASCN